ncbi:MAG: GAF domain-containing protein, partial [Actinomycetota bacterium]
AAMMSAKARGKDRSLLFDESTVDRPDGTARPDVRSMAHMKMLQSLSGKLNRLNDVRQIATSIATELKSLIDYHNCRVYLAQGNDLLPIASHGNFNMASDAEVTISATQVGVGITGRAAASGQPVLVPNALECDFAVLLPGTEEIAESIVAVPMLYGPRVNGVITISKLGTDEFDMEDVRLLEVLAGQASVALENARLYDAQRREAKNARDLLEFSDMISHAQSMHAIGNRTVDEVARLVELDQASLWLLNDRSGRYECVSHHGYVNDPLTRDLVKQTVSPEEAQTLIRGRKQPFIVTPDSIRQTWPDREIDERLLQTYAVAPMPRDAGVDGWLIARQPQEIGLFFTEDRLRLLAGLAYQSSVAMQKVLLYRNQKETADVANALLDFSRKLACSEDLGDILQRTAEQAAKILGSPKTIVWLQEPETGCLLPEATFGFGEEERRLMVNAVFPQELVGMLETADEPFVMWPGDHEGDAGDATSVTSAVAPLRLDGGRLGCIAATAPALGGYEFSKRKMRLLAGIADQAKLALNNAHSFETLESTFLSTVEALANALEAKDEYTSSHTRTIVDMSLDVGAAMGLDAKTLKTLEMGALFHDIGKIG